jgi:hypothetical protein
MQIDELEMIMAVEHLPRVRELSGLASHMVIQPVRSLQIGCLKDTTGTGGMGAASGRAS